MSLRLLLNENTPATLVEALKAAGHDVLWIRLSSPGATDEAVFASAIADR